MGLTTGCRPDDPVALSRELDQHLHRQGDPSRGAPDAVVVSTRWTPSRDGSDVGMAIIISLVVICDVPGAHGERRDDAAHR